MQNRVGQHFGNYILQRFLGQGGFAEVYLGKHIHIDLEAAIKILQEQLTASEATSFMQEARILAFLEHSNIIKIKEYDIKQNIPFLVMDFAARGSLRQIHRKGQTLPLNLVVSYVLPIASALQYAHDSRIIHRDLKPENILVNSSNTILLSDFGIAALSSSSSHSSKKGLAAGTYYYMAPEQITDKALPASDQYALAITVYEWLSGEVPFVGSIAEITAKHINTLPTSLRQRGIPIPLQAEAVIMRALAKNPRQRFSSVKEFALALQSSSQSSQSYSANSVSGASSKDSIVVSPPVNKTSGFTRNPPTQLPTPPQPRTTPHIPPRIDPSTSASPMLQQQAPTIYPYNVPSARTKPPSPDTAQPRKTNTACLVTTLVSLLLIAVIIVSSVLFIPKISSFFQTITIPGINNGPPNMGVSPLTLQATNGSSTSDCDYSGAFFGTDSGWMCNIELQNNGQNMLDWTATAPIDREVSFEPTSTGFINGGGNWPIHVHIPLKDCPGSIDLTITPKGGAPQKVTWTCS